MSKSGHKIRTDTINGKMLSVFAEYSNAHREQVRSAAGN